MDVVEVAGGPETAGGMSRRSALRRVGGYGLGVVGLAMATSASAQEGATPTATAADRFIAIRRYRLTEGSTFDDIGEIVERGFLPIVGSAPGFVAHSILDVGDGALVAVSVWETQEAATASTAIAADFVAAELADKFQGPPELTKGPAPVYREAGGGSGAATPSAEAPRRGMVG